MNTFSKTGITLAIMLLTLALAAPTSFADNHRKPSGAPGAQGGYSGPTKAMGGYSGPGPATVTIADAQNQADDTWVTLRGKIIQHDGDDMYTFQDASGQGKVEIDDKAWRGQHIDANTLVEMVAEIDKDWGRTEIEVKRIRKVQ